MSDDDVQPTSRLLHRGDDRSAPYPVSRMAPTMELVDLAEEIATADAMLANVAHARLKVIAEQMQALQAQARTILEQVRRDQQLHHARCAFKRIPGHVYHVYRRSDGSLYFSMLSPQEWGDAPDAFYGSFRLENDMSWTPADQVADVTSTQQLLAQLLPK